MVSPKTLAQGVATPARKSSASASVPIASSPAANVAVTAETIPAHANNTADSVRQRRITVSAVKIADNPSVIAARPASRSQQSVCVVQCAINRSVFAAETAENRTVESAAQGAYKGRPLVIAVKGVKRPKPTATVFPRFRNRQGPPS